MISYSRSNQECALWNLTLRIFHTPLFRNIIYSQENNKMKINCQQGCIRSLPLSFSPCYATILFILLPLFRHLFEQILELAILLSFLDLLFLFFLGTFGGCCLHYFDFICRQWLVILIQG